MASLELGEGVVVGGRYRIVRPLSAGAMGAVYVAEQIATKKQRALKVMQPELVDDARLRERFVQEAQIGAHIESEHIVEVIDAGVDDDKRMPWLAMELLRGETLGQLFAREGALGAAFVREVMEQLCHAVGAAHDKGVVHRDLKPDNVFLSTAKRVGGAFTVKVLDFGIAKLVSEAEKRFTAAIGTPLYMSPEQMTPGSSIGAPSDVWAIGLIAFQLLTGKSYWRAATAEGAGSAMLVNEVTSLPLEKASERAESFGVAALLPDRFDAWFARAVEREPGDRWGDAHDAWRALDDLLAAAPRGKYPDVSAASASRQRATTTDAASSDVATDAWLEQRKTPAVSPDATTEHQAVGVDAPVARTPSSPPPSTDAPRAANPSITNTALGATAHAPEKPEPPPARATRSTAWIALGAVVVVAVIGYVVTRHPESDRAASTAPSASASGTAAKLRVTGIECQDAAIEGEGASPELARAVGVGACARLAVEVGVEWRQKGATPLAVAMKLTPSHAEVTSTIGDRSGRGEGATPIEAVVTSVAALAPEITGPPPTAEEIHAWGAKDGPGARRVERLWRRRITSLGGNEHAEAKEVVASDPESPFPHLLIAIRGVIGSDVRESEIRKALDLLDRLPPARAKALRGALLFSRSMGEHKQGIVLLQQAYGEAPDDPDIAAIYGALAIVSGVPEQGFAVADRLWELAPTKSIAPTSNALNTVDDHDLQRDEKYLLRLREVLPETAASNLWVNHYICLGKFDEARAAIAFGDSFGREDGPGQTSVSGKFGRAWVELAEFRPSEARDKVNSLVGDPHASISMDATAIVLSSYFLEGRVIDGESAELREIERQRASISPLSASALALDLMRVRRWSGGAALQPEFLDWVESAIGQGKYYSPPGVALATAEIALARGESTPAKKKQLATDAIAAIERLAAGSSEGIRTNSDSILVATVPLLRIAKGDDAAVERWRETTRAAFRRRRLFALDAGLALEHSGDKDGALAAYKLSQDPILLDQEGLATLAGLVLEARLERSMKRAHDAARSEATLARLLTHADPGVREAIEKLR